MKHADFRFRALVFFLALLIGLLVSLPQIIHIADDRFKGIPIQLNADEYAYYARLQEPLEGKFGQGGKAVVASLRDEPGLVLAPIEEFYALFFRWTGLKAAWVFQIMDFVIPFFIVLVSVLLCRSFGLSRKESLIVTAVFCLMQLYNLGRPVNQRASFLLLLLCIYFFQTSIKGKYSGLVFGALLLSFLQPIYLWSWLAAWCVWLLSLIFIFYDGSLVQKRERIKNHLLLGIIGFFLTIPWIWRVFLLKNISTYQEAVERSGIRNWRFPESWPWTISTLCMAIAAFFIWRNSEKKRDTAVLTAFIISPFILMNQQVLHGVEIMFRNHYLMHSGLAALLLIVVLLCYEKNKYIILGFIAPLLIVAALFFEGRYVIKQWRVSDNHFNDQHLASALPILDALPETTIVSDNVTSSFIISYTHHYTVYTDYLFQSSLLSNNQIAQRYCFSVLPFAKSQRPEPRVLNSNIQLDKNIREAKTDEEREIIAYACELVENNISAFFTDYEVEYIFWDEKTNPLWNPTAYGVPIENESQGDGWSLWRVGQ